MIPGVKNVKLATGPIRYMKAIAEKMKYTMVRIEIDFMNAVLPISWYRAVKISLQQTCRQQQKPLTTR